MGLVGLEPGTHQFFHQILGILEYILVLLQRLSGQRPKLPAPLASY